MQHRQTYTAQATNQPTNSIIGCVIKLSLLASVSVCHTTAQGEDGKERERNEKREQAVCVWRLSLRSQVHGERWLSFLCHYYHHYHPFSGGSPDCNEGRRMRGMGKHHRQAPSIKDFHHFYHYCGFATFLATVDGVEKNYDDDDNQRTFSFFSIQ